MTALFDVPEALPAPVQPATLSTPANDDAGMVKDWTEDDVLRVLWRHFASQSWAAIPQVTVALRDLDAQHYQLSAWDAQRAAYNETTGADDYLARRAALTDRRIDMLLLRPPRKKGVGDLETLAIEVKVTRADFLSDVKNPAKQEAWRKAATRHAYAVPAGLVTADEVPEGSGLLAVKHAGGGWGTVEWVRRAPYVHGHAPELPRRVILALAHRTGGLEGHTRGWHTGPEAAGSPQELRAALQAANKAADRATKRAEKAEAKADGWQAAYALATPDGHPCQWCGRGLKPLNPSQGWFKRWRHVTKGDDEPCLLAERAEAEREARAEYDAADAEQRARKLREVTRWAKTPEKFEKEPWRAFMPLNYRTYEYEPVGPRPADVEPPAPNVEGE